MGCHSGLLQFEQVNEARLAKPPNDMEMRRGWLSPRGKGEAEGLPLGMHLKP